MDSRSWTQPVYLQIAEQLRTRIARGEFAPGAQLPTQWELVAEYGVARMTVRQAIGVLVNEGLVVSRKASGVFVRDRRPTIYRLQEGSAAAERLDAMDVAMVPASPEIARRLGLSASAVVVVRRALRLVDGYPHSIHEDYYPRHLVEGSSLLDPTSQVGADQVLADLGARPTRIADEITVRMPSPDESHRLDMLPGTPVAVHTSTTYTDGNRPVRYALAVLPGDRHVLTYERAVS